MKPVAHPEPDRPGVSDVRSYTAPPTANPQHVAHLTSEETKARQDKQKRNALRMICLIAKDLRLQDRHSCGLTAIKCEVCHDCG